jgi:signal transduction histidine kinase
MAYFFIAALILGYYGILHRLKPLRNINKSFPEDQNPTADSPKKAGNSELETVIDGMEQALQKVRNQIQQTKEENLALLSRVGVARFEQTQISGILDAIFFGIIVTDTRDNVIFINQYMLNLIRKKREDVIDRPLATVIENPEILSYAAQQDNILRTKALKPIEITLPELSPEERFQVVLNYLTDSGQELTGKMISIRNITIAKMAEESQQQFIAHVAHELRTPLTNIKSYSEMLMGGEVTDREMQREFYNTINAETDRLASLIHTLLNISKIEMGSLSVNKGLVRTDWFVDGCLLAIEASARDKHLTIEKRMPDNFPSLLADKELLQGAIINILGNALKYTPEQGKITFAISDQDDAVTFEVTDSGYGIAAEDLPHIFEKFYRSDNKEITAQKGSGLGLAITAEIVHLHGGHIDVQSDVGVGTHVTIRIPKEEHYLGKA